jgi:hypothetical protein
MSPLANLLEGLADRRCRLLAAMFLAAEALDMLTTTEALAHGGLAEGNPLFASLMAGDLLLALALKAGVVMLVTLGALAGLHGRRRRVAFRVFVLFGLAVVLSNTLAIARA